MVADSGSGIWWAATDPAAHPWNDGEPGDIPEQLLARRVLIIEDEAMIAWMLESLLEDMGFGDIRIAGNGQDAIALAGEVQPGLILSDVNLGPGVMDGIAATAEIRRSSRASVLFITAYADDDARARIARDVADAALLRKPIEPADLRRAIVAIGARSAVH